MSINPGLEKSIKQRRDNCMHFWRDRVRTPTKSFCGKCGEEFIFKTFSSYEAEEVYNQELWREIESIKEQDKKKEGNP